MSRCRCDPIEVAGCQCHVEDSDDLNFSGSGALLNAFRAALRLDPDSDNLMESSIAGVGAFLPPELANPPAVRLTTNVGQSIPTSTSQVLMFNIERYDTDSMHDIANNISRITINTPGVYIVSASVRWEGNLTGDRRLWLRINAGDTLASSEDSADQADEFDQQVTTQYKFQAGDYVETLVAQNSGSNLTVLKEASISPEFAAVRVAVG